MFTHSRRFHRCFRRTVGKDRATRFQEFKRGCVVPESESLRPGPRQVNNVCAQTEIADINARVSEYAVKVYELRSVILANCNPLPLPLPRGFINKENGKHETC
jgi:hypothetical protein